MATADSPSSIGSEGWSASGTLAIGQPNKQVSLQQVFPNANVWSVQFFVGSPDASGITPGHGPRPQARIEWVVQGNTVRRLVDVDSGVIVTGVGMAVRVTMFDAGAGDGRLYPVAILVARGSRPSVERVPTVAGGVATILAAGSHTFFAPVDAGVISVEVATSSGDPANPPYVTVQQVDLGSGVTKTYDLAVNDNTEFVPTVAGIVSITVTNRSAVTITATVSWGVDG